MKIIKNNSYPLIYPYLYASINRYIYKLLNRLNVGYTEVQKEMKIYDIIEKTARDIIRNAGEVLETKEILERVQTSLCDVTRTKLFSRLNNLRGDGIIKGKCIGSGKGVWIWWDSNLFIQHKEFLNNNCSNNQPIKVEAENGFE